MESLAGRPARGDVRVPQSWGYPEFPPRYQDVVIPPAAVSSPPVAECGCRHSSSTLSVTMWVQLLLCGFLFLGGFALLALFLWYMLLRAQLSNCVIN